MKKRDYGAILLALMCVFVVFQLFLMNTRLNSLVTSVQTVVETLPAVPERARIITPGDSLSSTSADRINGSGGSESLEFRARQTLLFVISPTCRHCTSSLPQLSSIYEKAKPHANVYMISGAPKEPLRAYIEEHHTKMETYSVKSDWLVQSGLSQTPTIVLVSSGGRVEKVWIGALSPSTTEEVIAAVTQL